MSTEAAPQLALGSPELTRALDAIAAGTRERERELRPPHDAIDIVRSSGLSAVRLPVEQGGSGADVRELFAILIALARADSNVPHILRTHFSFVEDRLRTPGEIHHDRWIGEIARGAIFGNAISELGPRPVGTHGNVGNITTTLSPHGDDYLLEGTKYYSTGSLYSDWVAVLAATPEQELAYAVIQTDRDGLTLEDDWDGIGQRLTATGTTRLERVFVRANEVLPVPGTEPGAGPDAAFLQLYLTAIGAGILHATADDAVALVRSRERTYTHAVTPTAAADPQLQQIVGEIRSLAYAAEAIVLHAADAIQAATVAAIAGEPTAALDHEASLQAAQAKVVVDGLAPRATTLLFDVGGASATKRSHDFDRHWRNVRTLASHNPTVYKARAIGDHEINGTPLPNNGFF